MDELAEHKFQRTLPAAAAIATRFRNGGEWWIEVPDDPRLKLLARRRLRAAGKLAGRRVETHYVQGRMWGGAEKTAGEERQALREAADTLGEMLFRPTTRA